ncbi:MAG: penicillin-binding protein 2 [Candidatus Gottesmanbacteria bacterium]
MLIRGRILLVVFLTFFGLIIARLVYWQLISADRLKSEAESQYFETLTLPASRGEIFSQDEFPIVSNDTAYLVYAELKKTLPSFSNKLAKILDVPEASISAKISPDLYWLALAHKVNQDKIDQIKTLSIPGIGWSREDSRYYPESSMAAQLLGFVGSDNNGQDKGYFGIEGFYDLELRGRAGSLQQEKDVRGIPIILGGRNEKLPQNGRNLFLYLDRTIQYIIEKKLEQGIQKYGAKQGSVVVMNPENGGILAMASWPNYSPTEYSITSPDLFKNPVVADLYEPGSTFKVIILSSALDAGVIKPLDLYQDDGPVTIGEYTIKTWNDKYHGPESVTQIIQHSCNTGMVWIGKKLGKEKMLEYLKNFGIGQKTDIDLQEEEQASIREANDWTQIDLATASFGQGIAVTPMQMLKAVSAIANNGKLMEPHVVEYIKDETGKKIKIKAKAIRQVVKPETASMVKEIMISAVDNGEAKWAKPKGYRIAGKTGTAQIPVAGHYDAKRTIASFVGFAPADKPKFVMLVRLTEPTSSPWGSETAAPLFFDISKDLFNYYGIPPQE